MRVILLKGIQAIFPCLVAHTIAVLLRARYAGITGLGLSLSSSGIPEGWVADYGSGRPHTVPQIPCNAETKALGTWQSHSDQRDSRMG